MNYVSLQGGCAPEADRPDSKTSWADAASCRSTAIVNTGPVFLEIVCKKIARKKKKRKTGKPKGVVI